MKRWGGIFDIPAKRAEVEKRQAQSAEAGFWDDPSAAERFLKELSAIRFWVTGYDRVRAEADDLDVLYDFAKESLDGLEEGCSSAEEKELDEA